MAELATVARNGLNPVVVFGTAEQCRRMLPPLIRGEEKACFAVTEPNVGLDTTRIQTRAKREGDRFLLAELAARTGGVTTKK